MVSRTRRSLGTAGPCIVVLDNAEHVTDEVCDLLPDLHAHAESRVVVTSRRRLGVPGEVVWRLGPMADDEAGRTGGTGAATHVPLNGNNNLGK
jgi:predicted ATPase